MPEHSGTAYRKNVNTVHEPLLVSLSTYYKSAVPELRIYPIRDRPVGPHPVAMFEINIFTPAQFGALIPWLAVQRGPLSVLVHPNTSEEGVDEAVSELRDHTERAMWLGDKIPLDLSIFRTSKVEEGSVRSE